MIDFKNVLGSLLESGLAPSASHRMGNALGPQGGGLSSILEGLAGRASQGGSQAGSVLNDLLSNAKQAASDTRSQTRAGNPVAVGGLGALAGAVLGGLRGSPAKGALGGAALAVLGQIAMQALQKGVGGAAGAGQPGLAEAGSSAPMATAGDEHLPMQDQASAELLLRAMINAAKADGQIDGAEMNAILSKLEEAGADQEAKDFVLAEMRRPLDLDTLVAGATTPGLAAAVYAASTMAIKVDTVAEQNYLAQLASRLELSPQVRASLDASLGVGRA
ncbi:MAG: tellurite resistance TerB family protein [Geminicoccaceae bacterium]